MTVTSLLTPPDERIDSAGAAEILGRAPGVFANIRRRLQMVYDRTSGELQPYPAPDTIRALYEATVPFAERRKREGTRKDPALSWYDSHHWLVVPEWGGSKEPGGGWTFSRRRCEALRDLGPEALGRHLTGGLQ